MFENIHEEKLFQTIAAFNESCCTRSQHSTKTKTLLKLFICIVNAV